MQPKYLKREKQNLTLTINRAKLAQLMETKINVFAALYNNTHFSIEILRIIEIEKI